jgi:hypothetical protein
MDQKKTMQQEAAPVEPRQDRLLAVLLEGVLDLEMGAARRALEMSTAPPLLVERALTLLHRERSKDGLLRSPVQPDRDALPEPLPGTAKS